MGCAYKRLQKSDEPAQEAIDLLARYTSYCGKIKEYKHILAFGIFVGKKERLLDIAFAGSTAWAMIN